MTAAVNGGFDCDSANYPERRYKQPHRRVKFHARKEEKGLFDDETCVECGSSLSQTRDESYCPTCGYVANDSPIDTTQEWRSFGGEKPERARTGAPLTHTRHDRGMSTEMGHAFEMRKLPAQKRAQYYRMRTLDKRLTRSKDKNMSFALSELQRVVSNMRLPKGVHEQTAGLYERAVDSGLIRGRSIESFVGALIYSTCRDYRTPRVMDDIAEVMNMDKRDLWKSYRHLSRALGLKIMPARPHEYVPRFASQLGLSGRTQSKAMRILNENDLSDVVSGKSPVGIAAAAVYVAAMLCNEPRTQYEVARVSGVTEVTVRNNYTEIVDGLGIEEEMGKRAGEYAAKTRELEHRGKSAVAPVGEDVDEAGVFAA